jgi:hypothetical protein
MIIVYRSECEFTLADFQRDKMDEECECHMCHRKNNSFHMLDEIRHSFHRPQRDVTRVNSVITTV